MPRKNKEKITEKLINYIKEDRPRKFRDYVRKYEVDLRNTLLPKRRTFLHCAAKHGRGCFINYLLQHGAVPSQVDSKGDLAIHVAIDRALHLPAEEAAEVYRNVVIPLLKEYPDAVNFCDRRGADLCTLLTLLNRHIRTADSSSDSDTEDTDSSYSESSDSEASQNSLQEDWSQRLATEFENENADFFGRYDSYDDYEQEKQKETFRDWSERMGRDIHQRHHQQFFNNPHPSNSQKRKHSSTRHSEARTKIPKGGPGINTKEAIHFAKAKQSLEKLRKTYEERFQAALKDKSEKEMTYGDIPWPGKGSLEHVMDVLFGDKADWTVSALKKFTREQRVRWHPDKFLQKFIDKIAPKSFEKVMERVKEISQALNKKAESLSSG
ncbi:hypothetical protein ACOMHN_033483 [Nucella lapillus]